MPKVVQRFLDCGLLENSFVHVRCPRCRAAFLVAFSCKCRYLCPSCHAKRLLIWSEWIEAGILRDVPHRQYVFTVPKRLRPYFLHDRRLLGLLSRTAYDTLRDFLRASLGDADVVPGVVASIQTFGSLLNGRRTSTFSSPTARTAGTARSCRCRSTIRRSCPRPSAAPSWPCS